MRKSIGFLTTIFLVLLLACPSNAGKIYPLGSSSASGIYFDNTTASLSDDPVNVQAAIEAIKTEMGSLEAGGLSDLDDLPGDTTDNNLVDFVLLQGVQPLESTLTDIADGTIAENLVNTANPWADNEVADTLTIGASSTVANGALDADLQSYAGVTPHANALTLLAHDFAGMRTDLGLVIGTNVQQADADLDDLADGSLSKSKVQDSANWDTAYGWGNHASAGYESHTSNDIDPDRLAGDTVNDDKVDAGVIADLSATYISTTQVFTQTFTIATATSSSDFLLWRAPCTITITGIYGVAIGGTNVVGSFDECDANGANPAAIDGDMTLTATNTSNTSLDNASVDAGDYIQWHTTSVSGSNTQTVVSFTYTIN